MADLGSNPECRTKVMTCARCGFPVVKPRRYYETPYHLECGIAEHEDYIIQMANHSGPYYERWLLTNGPKGRPKGGGTSFASADLDPFDGSIYTVL